MNWYKYTKVNESKQETGEFNRQVRESELMSGLNQIMNWDVSYFSIAAAQTMVLSLNQMTESYTVNVLVLIFYHLYSNS